MNLSLLRRLRRILNILPPQEQYTALRRLLAERLAGENAPWLNAFFPKDAPPIPKSALNAARGLLEKYTPACEGTPGAFTPEILGLSNELFSQNRRASGVFYTPMRPAAQLAKETLFAVLTRQTGLAKEQARALIWEANTPAGLSAQKARETDRFLHHLTVCDPAAGAGGLLVPFALELAALRRRLCPGEQTTGSLLAHILTHNLYAADVSARALADLQLRFALLLAAHGAPPQGKTVLPHTLEGDALAASANGKSVWQAHFPHVFTHKRGFDALLSNPPYVGQKNNRAVFDALRRNPLWQTRVEPKSDLLYFFFYLALDILRPGGVGGFLTTPYFATAQGAAPLRRELQERAAFLRLLDFEDERLFALAAGQHSLLSVFEKNNGPEKPPCRTGNALIPQQNLYEGTARYLQTRRPEEDPLSGALAKMAACRQTLREIAGVSNGLMTGCDKISAAHLRKTPMPGVKKGEGVFVLSEQEKNALDLNAAERKKLKPFFKNSHIHPYAADRTPGGWLVDFFYPNDRELDFALYPALRAHLARFKPALLARRQNNNGIHKQLQNGVYWFGSVRRKMDFEADKIAVPQRAPDNTFAFAPGPWYASSDVYFISNPANGISLWYLLALFNSAPYFAWLFYKGKRKGRLLELYSAPLNALPVPDAPADQRRRLETLARQMHNLTARHPAADISALQQEADTLAGSLFGFTPQETQAAVLLRRRMRAGKPKKL